VQTTIEQFGRVDVLVNNAGVSPGKLIDQVADEDMQRVLDVNLLAPARLTSAVVPQMKKQGSGIIINIGSVAGEVATSNMYAASKFGLRGLNDALRRELRHDRIAVVLIAPGFIRTAMTTGLGLPMPGPQVIAQAVACAIRQPRRKLVVPWYYQLAMFVAKVVPSFADAVLGSTMYQRNYRNRKHIGQTQSNQK
jgi:NAD(P)-dependent dehydrogenase (short-subunit alcohol dehydrogenase family)